VVYLLQVALFLVAYFLRYESDLTILGVFLGVAAAVFSSLRWAGVTQWRAHTGRALPLISDLIVKLRNSAPTVFTDVILWIMGIGIAAYATGAVMTAGRISVDLGVLCAALLLALAVSAWRRNDSVAWIERVVAYVGVVLVVYLDQTSQTSMPGWHALSWWLVGVVGFAALLRFAFAGSRGFEITSLDMLVVFVAVVIPMLPGPVQLPAVLTGGIAKTIILLYAVETLLGGELRRPVPRAILALTFAAIALRGFLALGA